MSSYSPRKIQKVSLDKQRSKAHTKPMSNYWYGQVKQGTRVIGTYYDVPYVGFISSHRSVLDVATGPAGVAIALARRTPARITGIDISNEMLSRARANVAAGGLAGRIALVLG